VADAGTQPAAVPGGYREVWRIAAPIVVSTASFTLMRFADRIFLSHYDPVSLGASFSAGMLAFTLAMFFQSWAAYAGTFVAQYHGAGRPEECARATAQGIWVALLTWPLGLALIPAGGALFRLAGHEADLLAHELTYFRILLSACGFHSLQGALAGFFSGRGDTRTPMVVNLAANAVNVLLDWAMVFGKCGFPRMGIAGAAWATWIASAVAAAMFLGVYLSAENRKKYATARQWRWHAEGQRSLFRFGFPAALHAVLDIGAFAAFQLLTARLPAADFRAGSIAFSINDVAFMPLLGMSIAAEILVGQYQGAREPETAAKSIRSAMGLSWLYMGAVAATFLLLPGFYLSGFLPSGEDPALAAELFAKGRWLLALLGLWGMADAVNIVMNGALKGAGDTRFVLVYSVVLNWALWIPGTAWLLHVLPPSRALCPVWLWMMAYVLVFAAGFWWRFRRGRWKRIEMI
jgi:MATE family multidrug resistance protein